MTPTACTVRGLSVIVLLGGLNLVVAAEEPAPRPPATIDLSKGGPTFTSGDNSLTIGAFIQSRFVGDDREAYDADTSGSGVGEEDGFTPAFDVTRLRLILRGGMFRPWLKYLFTWEVSRATGESDSKLKDGYLEVEKNHWATVKFGQYKVPFSLQEMVSDSTQQFPERSLTTVVFAPARDTGVTLAGAAASKRWGYSAGVFNGSGESRTQDDTSLLYAGRVWWEPLGEYHIPEGAVEMPEKAELHFAAAYRTGEAIRGGVTGVVEDVNDQTGYNLEAAWKFRRWFATGEWFTHTTERANPASLSDLDAAGWHVQGAFMAIPKKLEIGLRRAQVDPDTDTSRDRSVETRLGVNWYFQGHNLKLQTDFGTLVLQENAPATTRVNRLPSSAGESLTDKQVRVQFQLWF